MSKSTPICDLQNNSDTRPIVADILKEIQDNEGNNNDYNNEQKRAFDYQIDDHLHQESFEDERQPELETNKIQEIQELPELTFSVDEGDMLENELPIIQNENIMYNYYLKFKEPIIVSLVTILLFTPPIKNLINTILISLPINFGNNTYILLNGILAGLLYYLVKRYI